MSWAIDLAERRVLPDPLVRVGMRRLLPVFAATYGDESERCFARWRMFLMACSELFRYRGGDEWFVAHTLMRPRTTAAGN